MQNDFINLKNPINTGSGVSDKVLIALVDWFVEPNGIKSPGAWAAPGDDVLIKLSHEFKDDKGFIEFQLAPEKNSYSAKSGGDTGFVKFQNEINIIVPGSWDILHETMGNILNIPVIALIQDSNCPANIWYQVGTSCVPAYVSPSFQSGTTKEGQKGYVISITNYAAKVYLYAGEIVKPQDIQPVIARIIGNITGTNVSLDATASTVSGTVTYEYLIIYNDVNNIRQSIILPDNAEVAEFDTAILVNWNGEGFAVKLTVTNEIDSDTTETSDSTGQRPYEAGAFDDGFNDDFDFNL